MKLNVKEIAGAVSGKITGGKNELVINEIVTDSRKAHKGSLFVALKGENLDGHNFLINAFSGGCEIALVSEIDNLPENMTAIRVNDTKKALGDIAKYYLKTKNIKKIAVTGSVGKTTTKDMIYSVCNNIFPTLKTIGNFNNDIGLPLTVFRLEEEKAGIFEMGMNHFNEISYLSSIVEPDIAVITNIGYSHIENLGSREGILKAKLEVTEYMNKNSTIILNGDDELLFGAKEGILVNKIYIGIKNRECDILAENIKEYEDRTTFDFAGETYEINTPGLHNVYNALAAIAVGKLLTEDSILIKEGLKAYKSEGIRQNIIAHNGYKIIADCYNAAPDSMLAALDILNKVSSERKIAVFGSVAEIGEMRDKLLYDVGKELIHYHVDELVTVSCEALAINKGAEDSGLLNTKNFSSNEDALCYLKKNITKGDAVLIKGSRKYKMEEISEGLLKD